MALAFLLHSLKNWSSLLGFSVTPHLTQEIQLLLYLRIWKFIKVKGLPNTYKSERNANKAENKVLSEFQSLRRRQVIPVGV